MTSLFKSPVGNYNGPPSPKCIVTNYLVSQFNPCICETFKLSFCCTLLSTNIVLSWWFKQNGYYNIWGSPNFHIIPISLKFACYPYISAKSTRIIINLTLLKFSPWSSTKRRHLPQRQEPILVPMGNGHGLFIDPGYHSLMTLGTSHGLMTPGTRRQMSFGDSWMVLGTTV